MDMIRAASQKQSDTEIENKGRKKEVHDSG